MTLSRPASPPEVKRQSEETLLPYSTASLPGVGGTIRSVPAHFVVEEVPLYTPCGEGQHLYVNLTKTGLTTKEVQRKLAGALRKRERDVGFAGLKDKHAQTTQTFSINVQHAENAELESALYALENDLPIEIHWIDRHANKLKPGHLRGNRFRITITDLDCDDETALARAHKIAVALRQRGLPNYFGPQRFGDGGKNVARGLAILQRRDYVKDRWLRRFLISAYQSDLCNRYLAHRLDAGRFDTILTGDVAKKVETGGLFVVEDRDVEQVRYEAHEISFTAPLFGPKMRAATGPAGAMEDAILAAAPITFDDLAWTKVNGTRRLGRLLVPDLAVAEEHGVIQDGTVENADNVVNALIVEFFLPKGAFATSVLRELMKSDVQDTRDMDIEE